MTDEDEQTIRRVAKILGFNIRERTEFESLAVYNKHDINRSDFVWFEPEGFDEFFIQLKDLNGEYWN